MYFVFRFRIYARHNKLHSFYYHRPKINVVCLSVCRCREENRQTQPIMTPSLVIEPGPHCWEAIVLKTIRPLPPQGGRYIQYSKKGQIDLSLVSKHDVMNKIDRRLTLLSSEVISFDIKFSCDNFRTSSIFVSI